MGENYFGHGSRKAKKSRKAISKYISLMEWGNRVKTSACVLSMSNSEIKEKWSISPKNKTGRSLSDLKIRKFRKVHLIRCYHTWDVFLGIKEYKETYGNVLNKFPETREKIEKLEMDCAKIIESLDQMSKF